MSTVTLEEVKATQTRLAEMIAKLEASAAAVPPRKVTVHAATIDLQPGEHYAGLVLADDGGPSHHLVLLAGEAEDIDWPSAKDWAAAQGGELPTRQEQALLYANLKSKFQPEWYWSSQAHESDGSYAWYQDFLNGSQDDYRKSDEGRARAVRRLTV